jgi:hypothetical protein
MRAEIWRDSRYVGFFIVAPGGRITEDFAPSERDRIAPVIKQIVDRLSEPGAWSHGLAGADVRPTPGDREWIERFLAELQNEGYEHRLLEDDGYGRG